VTRGAGIFCLRYSSLVCDGEAGEEHPEPWLHGKLLHLPCLIDLAGRFTNEMSSYEPYHGQ
jgi:hypothetical protein